ncbi:MAG: hypothetical protein RRZ24_09395 [Clostridia bacterium]
MKKALCSVFIVTAMLCVSYVAFAEDVPVSLLDTTDTVLRTQIRLSDLGYDSDSIRGVLDEAAVAALSACRKRNYLSDVSVVPESMFQPLVAPVPYGGTGTFARSGGGVAIIGVPMTWEEAKAKFVIGTSYSVTSCYTGIVFHLRYQGGDVHADMTPVIEWDEATILGLFGDVNNYAKQPIVIDVDHTRIAASLQVNLHEEMNDAEARHCCIFFTGSVSGINGITDIDHVEMIHIASGQENKLNITVPTA